jgi:hypothetical protein
MKPILSLACLLVLSLGAEASGLRGKYIESRTCDIWTGPCYANAEVNLAGKNAVMGWSVEEGEFDGVKLDGLGVVAVITASDTLGLKQNGKTKTVLIVDSRANQSQRAALIALAKKQGGEFTAHIAHVDTAKVSLDICECKENGCAVLEAGKAKIETRCLNAQHDKVCGNESAFYPPLIEGVKVTPAMAVESSYNGKGVGATWNDANRRGAYVGTFSMR